MALAAKLKGEERRAVAVIGDGAMTAGMAFEALNNAGVSHAGVSADLLVVLNDNDMSISPPVGALNKYLARLMSGSFYAAAREGAKSVLKNAPPLFELARRFEEHAKGMVVPGTIFEEFGFNYVGPIDGHDLDALIPTLENLRAQARAAVPARRHARRARATSWPRPTRSSTTRRRGKFDPAEGFPQAARRASRPSRRSSASGCATWPRPTSGWSASRRRCAKARAWSSSSKRFPKRYYDVGIAEQHAVTFAAGMACEGLKPVVAIYTTFLQRGYDQLIHDVAIQNLPVVFALDRAGLVGADGATHAGAYDIAFVRCVPNMSLLTPADENECRQALTTAFRQDHPVAVRYPRGAGVGAAIDSRRWPNCPGARARSGAAARRARGGPRIAILAFGTLLHPALQAAEKLDATVVNMRFVKPLDGALVLELARTPRRAGHRRGRLRDGRRRQRGAANAWPRTAWPCRCCSWACPTSSSSTATRPSCWRCAGWTPPASSSRCCSASAAGRRWSGRRRTR